MFRDTQEELDRLQEALLEEEKMPEEGALTPDGEDDFPHGEGMVYRNYSNEYGKELRNFASGYHAYNADRTDVETEEFAEEVREPKKSGVMGLVILALVLTAGILALAAWWLVRYLGLAG